MLPIIEISKNGDFFTIIGKNNRQENSLHVPFETTFRLGEEFVIFYKRMGNISTRFTIEDNKLIQVSQYTGKSFNIISELNDNMLTIEGSVGDVVFTRVYHKI